MVKSSEVLRLAAEYALEEAFESSPHEWAQDYLKCWHGRDFAYMDMVDYDSQDFGEHTCIALCLAAAIAEYEGD